MPSIHPSSVVDPSAQLADDVTIGPHCVIDGPAVIGAGTRLIANVYLHGRVTLGEGNTLYPGVSIGFEPQAHWFKGETRGVEIGDRNLLRENFTMHCGGDAEHATTMGSDNLFMTNTHIGHDCVVGSHCTAATGATLGGHVTLDDRVNLGGTAVVHQFCRLGTMCFLGGLGGITKDLPPYCLATSINRVMSLNVIGLRRAGTSGQSMSLLQRAFKLLYLSKHTQSTAKAMIREMAEGEGQGDEVLATFLDFLETSERGIVPHVKMTGNKKITR